MNKKTSKEIKQAEEQLFKTLSLFTDEQFSQIPFEGSWTGGQVAEHLLKSDATPLLFGNTEKTTGEPGKNIKLIREQFLNFNTKMKNPDFNTPSNGKHNKKEIIDSLTKMYKKAEEAAVKLDLTQTCLDFGLPNMGKMTRLEWLYFMIYHTQRHTHQLKNILSKLEQA